jgi:DHA2 family multidrug resistance protein
MISWHRPGTVSRSHPVYPLLILANVLVTTFLAVLSAVATIISDDSIQGELGLSNTLAVWLTTLYLLGVNTTVPTASWFADRFGYKTMYAIGVTLFAVSSAIAGVAENFATIAIARSLEGIGAGFIFPVGLAMIVQNISPKRLPLALILYVGASFGAGFALGFPISGYLTQFLSWRIIFFTIVPLGLLGSLSCWLIHEETERKTTSLFDFGGFFSFALFIASLLVALTYGPLPSTDGGWRSPYILALFAIAALSLLSTILIERKKTDPLLPLVLFKDPLFSVSCIAMFLLGMSIFASGATMMQYMIDALFYEKYVSGKMGITYGLSLALSSILANGIIKKIPVPVMTFAGLSLLVYSYFLNNILDHNTGPDQIFWILLLRGTGVGLALGPTTIQAMKHVPKELSNKGATLITFFRQVGGTYGGTLISIVTIKRKIFHAARFGEQANDQLPAYKIVFNKLYSRFYSSLSDKGAEAAAQAKEALIRNIEIQAFIQAINDAMIVFGCVTGAVALLLASLSLHRWWKNRGSKAALTD